jgi:MFS family permease
LWKALGEKFLSDAGTLNQSQVSIILMMTVPAVLCAYAANGFLAEKIGRKPLLYLWTSILPIGTIILVLGINDPHNAFAFAMIGLALTQVGFWGLFTLSRLVTIELLPTDKRGTGTGLRALFFAVGTTIGLLIGAVFILFFGLGIVFFIFSLAMFIILPLIYFSLKETKGVELSEIK